MKNLLIIFLLLLIVGCGKEQSKPQPQVKKELIELSQAEKFLQSVSSELCSNEGQEVKNTFISGPKEKLLYSKNFTDVFGIERKMNVYIEMFLSFYSNKRFSTYYYLRAVNEHSGEILEETSLKHYEGVTEVNSAEDIIRLKIESEKLESDVLLQLKVPAKNEKKDVVKIHFTEVSALGSEFEELEMTVREFKVHKPFTTICEAAINN